MYFLNSIFFWIQTHHTQQQPGMQIWYNCVMFSYFNSTCYKYFCGSCVACLSYMESVTRSSVVLITERSYCSLLKEPASVLWSTPTSHLSVISHSLETLSMFLHSVISLQVWNGSLTLYWLEPWGILCSGLHQYLWSMDGCKWDIDNIGEGRYSACQHDTVCPQRPPGY